MILGFVSRERCMTALRYVYKVGVFAFLIRALSDPKVFLRGTEAC